MKLLCNLLFFNLAVHCGPKDTVFLYMLNWCPQRPYQCPLSSRYKLFPNIQTFLLNFFRSFSIYKALICTKVCFWIEYSLLDWKLHTGRSIYCSHCMPVIYVPCSVQLKETQVSKRVLEFLQRTDGPGYLKLILPKFVTPS